MVVADDNLLIREGIVRVLEQEPDIVVVGTGEDQETLLRAIEEQDPDVVVTDIRMPPTHGMEGITVALGLHESHPGTGVIVISQYADPEYAVALLRHGSARRGYVLKDRLGDRAELAGAIREVAAGGSVVDPQVVERLVEARQSDGDSPMRSLTEREREVLAQLATGKSNAAIGRSLQIGKRAVEHHVGAIFAKLDLPEEEDVNRRVTATLIYLAARARQED